MATSIAYGQGERPSWISTPPSSTRDVYVVGIGDGASANDAQNEARQRGWVELVEQVLGVDGVSTMRAESDVESANFNQRTEISTAIVQFKTLITINKFIEELESGGFRCFLLLKLPEREVVRLRKLAQGNGSGRLLSRLIIDSQPSGAQVTLDGDATGTTPVKLLLPPKGYRVQLRKKGYKPVERMIALDVGKDLSLNIPLEQSTGTLIISVEPQDATILLDDESIGVGPMINTIVPTGSHDIKVKADGYRAHKRHIHIRENKDHELQVVLKKEVKRPSPPKTPPVSASWDDKARRLVKRGAWPQLVSVGRDWLSQEPYSSNAHFYTGYGLLKLRRTESAIPFLERSKELNSNSVVLEALCEAYNQARQYRKALSYCEQSLERDLKSPGAYSEVARSYQGLHDHRKAYENMMVAVSLNRAYYSELRRLCRTTLSLHNYEECARINYPALYR